LRHDELNCPQIGEILINMHRIEARLDTSPSFHLETIYGIDTVAVAGVPLLATVLSRFATVHNRLTMFRREDMEIISSIVSSHPDHIHEQMQASSFARRSLERVIERLSRCTFVSHSFFS